MGANQPSAKKNVAKNTSFNPELIRTAVCNGAANCNGLAPGALIPMVQDCRLRKVLQKIASASPQTIQDLALECNLSESHLQHLFKECTGLGLGRLLIEQRMQRAVELLEQTNLSIKEIAWTVGYEHTSSFSRAFERHFREAPRCFRQSQERQNGNGKKEQL
jgi:transcriptional regulator GlxA family with amidase domain